MPGTHPRQELRSLGLRRREVPHALRRLWGTDRSVEGAVDLCDDLLADIDLVITAIVDGLERDLPWEDLAEEAIALKQQAYAELVGFCTVRNPTYARVLERSMLRDLADSNDRVRAATSRAAARTTPRSIACS